MRYLVVGLLFLIFGASSSSADSWLQVYADSTMDGRDGVLVDVPVDGEPELDQTWFMFKEGDFTRLYAAKPRGAENFDVFPQPVYIVKEGMQIGDTWDTYLPDSGAMGVCEVIGYDGIVTQDTLFACYRVEVYDGGQSLVSIRWFACDIGWIAEDDGGDDSSILSDFVVQGRGFLDLSVGNWWRYYDGTIAFDSAEIVEPTTRDPGLGGLTCWPNPSRGMTSMEFHAPQGGVVEISVFDPRGARVARFFRHALNPGLQRFSWEGRTDGGAQVSTGIYLVRVSGGGVHLTAKLLVVE